jgi:exodeoxyribonuclease-3
MRPIYESSGVTVRWGKVSIFLMRLLTLNVNGVRSAATKGLVSWLSGRDAEIVCLQEIRAAEEQLPSELLALEGYRAFWHCAERKGYSGVGLLSRRPVEQVVCGIEHPDFEREGRILRADFAGFSVLSVYIPSGIMGGERQAQKMRFLDAFLEHLAGLKSSGRELIVCGDFNISHKPIDLYDPKRHANTSGYFPEERAWMDRLLEAGFVDVFRKLVGPEPGHYTWWSNFRGARARNLGWRLDYQIATPGIAERAQRAVIERDAVFSDHAPLIVEYSV